MTDISNADYHADPAVSASHLKKVMQSPYHYWSAYLNPDRVAMAPTAAMRLGSLVHCAVLEPDELTKRYQLAPDRRTKEGKAAVVEMAAAGIEAVSEADLAQALQMADAVRSNSTAALLLSNGQAEQSFWWDDIAAPEMRCKCRPDWLSADGATIVDLKTCQDASPASFAKAISNFGYSIQAAHYLAGTLATRFIFVAVEKSFPYAIGCYELNTEALIHGSIARHNALQRLQDCRALQHWPGYTDGGIQTLQLPGWALKTDSTFTSEDF